MKTLLKMVGMLMMLLCPWLTSRAETDVRPVMCVFGDSYVRNHRCPQSETWHAKVADRLGFEYVNCGRNGSSVGLDRTADGFGPAMTSRISELPEKADVVIIIAGHNDADMIAGGRPYTLEDFSASLSLLLSSLAARYPDASIGYVTPWGVDRPMFREVIAEIKRVCGAHGVPVLDAAATSGIDVNNPEFRAKYFQGGGVRDTAHLNDDGHNLLVDWGKEFVRRISGRPFEAEKSDRLSISLPSESRPVVAAAAGILASDFSRVLDADLETDGVPGKSEIEVAIDPEAVRDPQGFRLEVTVVAAADGVVLDQISVSE